MQVESLQDVARDNAAPDATSAERSKPAARSAGRRLQLKEFDFDAGTKRLAPYEAESQGNAGKDTKTAKAGKGKADKAGAEKVALPPMEETKREDAVTGNKAKTHALPLDRFKKVLRVPTAHSDGTSWDDKLVHYVAKSQADVGRLHTITKKGEKGANKIPKIDGI